MSTVFVNDIDVSEQAKKTNSYTIISIKKDVLLKVVFSGASPSPVVAEDVDRAYVKANRYKDGFVLVDVRPAEYFNGEKTVVTGATAGHIPGAINVPKAYIVASSDVELAAVGLDKSKTVIVYCNKGVTSPQAATALVNRGFTSVKDYKGGMADWGTDTSEVVQMKGLSLDLTGSDSGTISLDVVPETSVVWTVSDPSVLKLDSATGLKVGITALKAGSATVTATISGQAKAETDVTVAGTSGGSSGGCNVGLAPAALLFLIPLAFLKR
ncbi:SYNERG-CTERM sorting domain-containing protein [Dethiosulfovibrio sp. F2B]|uniref:rhodanese-like domain-containing protein n=1 Tax=Dethiosulfovibrio faecalis TaxID=2720018 RepID=UPI001F3E3FDE|nr:rhodanese-like domain-containing protein [Dethiosulfovibrio faecalis]MCF4152662.1 SYNERG-CTERM sorting domain-containing protein [Dethiosulfovibrio faecalis]